MNQDLKELKEMMKSIYEIMKDEELADAIASSYRNIYCKLVEKGFTADQAITILSRMNFAGSK